MKIHELPLSVCNDCLSESQEDKATGMAVVYCEHNQAGAYYRANLKRWTTICPVTRDEFSEYFEARRLVMDIAANELRPDSDY